MFYLLFHNNNMSCGTRAEGFYSRRYGARYGKAAGRAKQQRCRVWILASPGPASLSKTTADILQILAEHSYAVVSPQGTLGLAV